ncbi:MAG: UDP-2,3-diacylglucosamine diphosphatase LpxI [Thermoguttaceae bacterium]|nr:UDP-2,3-diacylglucosamine diphosphatase LpxI [Thermoguttaceae bacterium]MBR5758915.1 UDP-2,3-diacylglucosamine diphosphatase LpxI [Thermoguttaceae bacterium]
MQPQPPNVKRVGLIAGQGRYPILLAEALKRAGYEVVCMGVRDHADPVLAEICDVFVWNGMGKFGRATKFLRKQNVEYATLAGKIQKVRLYDPAFIWKQAPDLYTIRFFANHFLRRREDCKNDSLLNTVCRAFEERGIKMLPGTDFAPELLVERKLLTKRAPTSAQLQDVFFGWKIARVIGQLDVGQSVSVKNRDVLAVEALEGTDGAIRRAGQLCKSKNFVVIKIAKPNQDMRFDVPTFGLDTVKTMAEAGASVLAFEAGKSILMDAEEVIKFADAHGISIISIAEEDVDNPATIEEFAVDDKRIAVGVAASANPE